MSVRSAVVIVIIVVFPAVPAVPVTFAEWWQRGRSGHTPARRWRHQLSSALDDFIQFPAIQPDAPALGTEVDFNTLSLGHG